MTPTVVARRTARGARLLWLVAVSVGAPTILGAQIVLWGNDPSRIGFTETGTWFPTLGGSKWSCPFPVVCVPPNRGTETVYIGYLAYDTFRGIRPPGLPLDGGVTLNGNASVISVSLGTGARGRLDVGTYDLHARSLVVGNEASTDVRGVRQPGVGTLNVASGGGVHVDGTLAIAGPANSPNSDRAATVGSVNVSGTGALTTSPNAFAMLVGAQGDGALRITAGGTVSNGSQGIIGWLAGSNGSATVDGAASSWTAKKLAVGSGGTGTLIVRNGGRVDIEDVLPSGFGGVTVAAASGSRGTLVVTGAGSQLSSTSGWGLDVGNSGAGELVVERGASVMTGRLFVAPADGTGTAVVDAATVTVTGGLRVGGRGGPGALTVRSGGTVTAATSYVGSALGPSSFGEPASVLVDDATLNVAGSFNIATTRYVDARTGRSGYGTGTVKVRNGGRVSAGSLAVGPGGTLDIDPATVEVLGDFALLPGGVLSIGVEGAAPGLFSQLLIGGFGLFQGDIFVNFMNGFAPSAGQTFSLITAAGGADFSQASVNVSGLQPGFQFTNAFSDGTWTFTAVTNGTVVPEPGSLLLVGSGLLAMACAGARAARRQRAA